MRLRTLALLVAASGLAACDFTPTLDIETPEFVPGVAVRAVLVADSAAVVRLGEAWDPYAQRAEGNRRFRPETPVAVVTLLRGGEAVDVLALRSEACEDYGSDAIGPYECGAYVGTVPVEAGGTYTLRVEAVGLPPAEATVTVPRRPEVEVTDDPGTPRRLRIRLSDPAGAGDLYGLALYSGTFRSSTCDETGCRDTTIVLPPGERNRLAYDTSDPVLVAAAREFDDDITFASFPDDTFEGRTATFTISPSPNYGPSVVDASLTVQVAALSADVYDAYLIAQAGGGGDDNPFAEPVNLPSNVEGGYGLVGAVALAEVTLPARE